MLQEISLQGIKAFGSRVTLRFGRCTVIAGRNSSGKSTIFQSLLLIKQAYERSPRSLAGMPLNGQLVSIGTYEDWSTARLSAACEISVTIGAAGREPEQELRRAVRAGAPRPWWWRVQRGNKTVKELRIAAQYSFAPTESEATAASLTKLVFRSEAHSLSRSRRLFVSVGPRSRPPPQAGTFPEDDANVQFSIDARFEATDETGKPAPEGGAGHGLCGINGLQFVTLLQETQFEAARRTLTRAIRVAIDAIVAQLRGKMFQAAGIEVVQFVEPTNPYESEEFIRGATDMQFLTYWEVSYDLKAATLQTATAGESWGRAGRAFSARLLTISAQSGMRDKVVDQKLRIEMDDLRRRYPELSDNIDLGLIFDASVPELPTEHQEFRDLVSRACSELRDDKHTFRLVRKPQEILELDKTITAVAGDLRDLQVPTETDLQTYFEDHLFHLGPLRDEPRSLYPSNLPNDAADVGRNGERAIECLRRFGNELVRAPVPGSKDLRLQTLMQATQEWCRFLGITESLTVSQESKYGTVCRVTTPGGQRGAVADMTNVGVGVSQLLPVVVLCMAAPAGSTILIEQPELHLHPSAQVRLATLLSSCTNAGKQLVVETHSEHLINGLRLAVAQTQLPVENLALLYLSRDEFGTEVNHVVVGGDGSLAQWPKDFFDEGEKMLLQLLNARMSTNAS